MNTPRFTFTMSDGAAIRGTTLVFESMTFVERTDQLVRAMELADEGKGDGWVVVYPEYSAFGSGNGRLVNLREVVAVRRERAD